MNITEIIMREIAPLLEAGKRGEGIHLSRHACESLLFVLRTAVPLEPFTQLFSEIMKKTLLPGEEDENA